MNNSTAVQNATLSNYFPMGTYYFYGYPTGDDSGFLNQVPPEVEELVAARTNVCAGPNVSVISFAATSAPLMDKTVLDEFAIAQTGKSNLVLLPDTISPDVKGEKRNQAIRKALQTLPLNRSLVMAQPYVGDEVEDIYQIAPEITTWLNDKQNLQALFTDELLPKRLGTYTNGQAFVNDQSNISVPVVIKASSSSSGDGVYICKDTSGLKIAVKELASIKGAIIVEQYIDERKNYGLHFGISHDQTKPIDFLGINEQLTTDEGEFIGGIINAVKPPEILVHIKEYLESVALPKVRAMGWYGVGCFDVLIDETDNCYVVDSNFRMTGMTAYHFMVANGYINTPLMGFNGLFGGSKQELEANLRNIAGKASSDKFMQIIAMTYHDNIWRFNAALMFDNYQTLKQRCQQLKDLGIESDALDQLTK